ncbi:hypothetical protein HJC23_005769 [Cyclotella cryptica]|uniref:Uncharacterized protein n=1 Tax=Cyclotella cryptica TaxID=29204 RepID=A0ABD3NWM9_9STRA
MKVALLAIFTFAIADNVLSTKQYPQQALQCYASSALKSQKDGIIICPADRSNYCIKEVINATSRADCGTVPGIYYGRDVWDIKLAQCVYRKCAAKCPSVEEDRKRLFGGGSESNPKLYFNRTSYCCQDNLCNSGRRQRMIAAFFIGIALAVNAIEV